MPNALIVMAKRPVAGAAKTRLCPPLTRVQAASLYECFLRDVIATAGSIPDVLPYVAYPDEEDAAYFVALAPTFGPLRQRGTDLGERLDHVLSGALDRGATAVAAINSDSPQLPAGYITDAFALLESDAADVVLGPCDDGGYYLIALTRPHPRLTRDVRMSTPHALADTLRAAQEDGLRVALLPSSYDVDVWSDVLRLRGDLAGVLAAPYTRDWLDDWNHRGLFRVFCEG